MDFLNTPLTVFEIFDFGNHPPTIGFFLVFVLLVAVVEAWMRSKVNAHQGGTAGSRFMKALPVSLMLSVCASFLLLMAGMLLCFLLVMIVGAVITTMGVEGSNPTAKVIVSWISLGLSIGLVFYLVVLRPRPGGN